MDSAIRYTLSNFPLIMGILALILTFGTRFFWKSKRSLSEDIVLYWLLLPVGATGLWGFFFHAFMPEVAASSIGWGLSPFQFEVAVADLGIGILGITGFFLKRFHFNLAVIIISICFFWGASFGHIQQILLQGNWAPNNAGTTLWMDILTPLVLVLTLIFGNPKRWKR